MNKFQTYLEVGYTHIADLAGYDHILFITVLCIIYKLAQWKHILILITAFTIGHSITLGLAALKIFTVPAAITEFLIPITIIITALYNVISKQPEKQIRFKDQYIHYFLTLFIGFIHGMGFSYQFSAFESKSSDIILVLFSFNLGLEVGQIMIMCFVLAASFIMLNLLRVKHREWNLFISGAAAGIAFIIMTERYTDFIAFFSGS